MRAPIFASCRWAIAAACAVAACCSLPSRVHAAAADSVELSWEAPEACSSAADVLRAIDAQLGAQFSSVTKLRASGRMSVLPDGGYSLDLRYSSAAGAFDVRRISGESCETVTRAAALSLALALDPSRGLQLEAAPQPSAPPPTPEEHEAPAFSIALLGLLDTPVLGLPAIGAGARTAFRLHGFELNASIHWFFPREQVYEDIALRLQYWSIGVAACYLWRASSWAFGPCASFELGSLSGDPQGEVDAPSTGHARVHAATFGGSVRVPLWAALDLTLDASLEWVARRPQFQVTPIGTIASSSVFGARLSIGPRWTY